MLNVHILTANHMKMLKRLKTRPDKLQLPEEGKTRSYAFSPFTSEIWKIGIGCMSQASVDNEDSSTGLWRKGALNEQL